MLSRRLFSLNPTQRIPKYSLNACTNYQRTFRITFIATRPLSFTRNDPPKPPPKPQPLAIRLLPPSLQPDEQSTSSLKRIYQLALTEKKPLSIAIGLVSNTLMWLVTWILTLLSICQLLVSSSVSMSVPFTIGRIIDYFTSPNPVGVSLLEVNAI
jgi:hypothetical protein